MALILPRSRTRELYLITAEHAGTLSPVPVAEGLTAEAAAEMMAALMTNHERFVKDSAIIDHGRPVYRLWKLWGSSDREDLETL